MRWSFGFLLCAGAVFGQWAPQVSNTKSSLRGVSAVSTTVAWASGTKGTYLKTVDGGRTWKASQVPGAETLDFRDVQAFDASHAYLMSVGPGQNSRIYKTSDGGANWQKVLQNEHEKGFFDAIAFWNPIDGVVMGDAVNGRMYVATTSDGGSTWKEVDQIAPAREGEGAFAASGTCLVVGPRRQAWMATGGTGGSRVYYSKHHGRTWDVTEAPIQHGNASSGIFSIAFHDNRHGIVVGGDYAKSEENEANIAITVDGKRWTAPNGTRPRGFRSAVAYLPGTSTAIAAGTNGSDYSKDGGKSWSRVDDGNYNAISFASKRDGWAVGPNGTISKWTGLPR